MSSETDQPNAEAPVLTHKAATPAIPVTSQPTPEELAFDWTLSPKDIRLVLKHRGHENLLRFAIQLCVLKKHGRFLSDYMRVPPMVLGYLCRQLEIKPLEALTGRTRDNTEGDYQREIAAYLGWQPYDEAVAKRLKAWIAEQVSHHLYVDHLVEKAENWLREQRIVIPGPVVFEREVNAAYRTAEGTVFQRIAAQIPPAICQTIDRLLTLTDPSGKTDFMRFAEYPPEAKAKHIVRFLERYHLLTELGIEQVRFTGVGRELLQRLAAAVRTYDAWQIRRFDADKRYALAACFLYEAKKTLLDYLVAMHAQFMTAMERRSHRAWEEEHRRLRKQVRRGVALLRGLARLVLDLRGEQEAPLSRLFERVDVDDITSAVKDCEAFEQLQAHGYMNQLRARYGNFRRYFRYFIHLNFRAESVSRRLLDAIELLRKLDAGQIKTLPAEVDISFVPAAWHSRLMANAPAIDRRTWEIALALALREALRAGEIYLPDSRRHVSFWDLCYDRAAWEDQRPAAYQALGLPVEADSVLTKLVHEFRVTAERMALNLPTNPFAEIIAGELRFKRDPALEEPPETPLLRQLLAHSLSKVRIERLLMAVDASCHFTAALKPLGRAPAYPRRHYAARLAALTAHGTNIGVWAMADSTEGMTVDQLQEVSRTCLRPETIRAANAILVNEVRSLPLSAYYGDGRLSSSDGQRFGVQRSSLLTALYPRYFGYYDRAVTVYTHMSNQLSVFGTEAISCAEREAPYVLDGLLENDTELDIQAHTTDTHGFTEQIFGLCFLLGFSFMPRLKDLASQQLYAPEGREVPEGLRPLFSGTVDLDLIREQWDPLVRVAASLKNRIVPAHVIAKRLVSAGSGNRLAKALTHLGRLVKTTYLLGFIDDPALRRMVGLQLNRGEFRQKLARHTFFANQGEFRSGDYFEIMNKASCLSLLSNAILVYNTIHIGNILDQAQAAGRVFSPEAIAHVPPLLFDHVIVNGTYDFSDAKPIR
jgi:TnpA family transposase